jgi:hypothetical protein
MSRAKKRKRSACAASAIASDLMKLPFFPILHLCLQVHAHPDGDRGHAIRRLREVYHIKIIRHGKAKAMRACQMNDSPIDFNDCPIDFRQGEVYPGELPCPCRA